MIYQNEILWIPWISDPFRENSNVSIKILYYFREVRLINLKFQKKKPAKPITSAKLFILI